MKDVKFIEKYINVSKMILIGFLQFYLYIHSFFDSLSKRLISFLKGQDSLKLSLTVGQISGSQLL